MKLFGQPSFTDIVKEHQDFVLEYGSFDKLSKRILNSKILEKIILRLRKILEDAEYLQKNRALSHSDDKVLHKIIDDAKLAYAGLNLK